MDLRQTRKDLDKNRKFLIIIDHLIDLDQGSTPIQRLVYVVESIPFGYDDERLRKYCRQR